MEVQIVCKEARNHPKSGWIWPCSLISVKVNLGSQTIPESGLTHLVIFFKAPSAIGQIHSQVNRVALLTSCLNAAKSIEGLGHTLKTTQNNAPGGTSFKIVGGEGTGLRWHGSCNLRGIPTS